MYPNLIIAGTNKAGTTSLFRYLADHPDVCPAAIKEVRHFTREADPQAPAALARYAAHFSHHSGEAVCLEASPDYLSGGAPVAAAIRAVLPEARLVFVLREPASRLISSYRRRQARQDPDLEGVTLQAFLDELAAAGADGRAAQELAGVEYAALLEAYLACFPVGQIAVRFFDDLRADTATFVEDICRFVGVDASFYANYRFAVENKTRSVRFRRMQRLAHQVNMSAEPLLNRAPGLRRGLRHVYNRLNTKHPAGAPELADELALQARLAAANRRLARLMLEHYPEVRQPAWLRRDGVGASAPESV